MADSKQTFLKSVDSGTAFQFVLAKHRLTGQPPTDVRAKLAALGKMDGCTEKQGDFD